MRVRRLRVLVALSVAFAPAGARAGDHRLDLLLAPSYERAAGSTIHLGGWHVSAAATLKEEPRLSFIGDLSVHFFGSHDERDVTQVAFMAGPRWTFFGHRKNMPFVHLMAVGATYRSEKGGVSSASGAIAAGIGYDFVPVVCGHWGVRGQYDLIKPIGSDQERSHRFSLGVVYRFHRPASSMKASDPCRAVESRPAEAKGQSAH
ncbi:MAG TPA: hypothetical protein VLL75_14745 [Vicinamibacteria bacterium]|nr:hypothetical protein [Vicinamibacteria bacterium]